MAMNKLLSKNSVTLSSQALTPNKNSLLSSNAVAFQTIPKVKISTAVESSIRTVPKVEIHQIRSETIKILRDAESHGLNASK